MTNHTETYIEFTLTDREGTIISTEIDIAGELAHIPNVGDTVSMSFLVSDHTREESEKGEGWDNEFIKNNDENQFRNAKVTKVSHIFDKRLFERSMVTNHIIRIELKL